jgi:hypothetical protein
MTITRFRALLIASFLSLVAALVIGLLPGGYSPALADFIGLFLLTRWGRMLSLCLTLLGLPLYLVLVRS